VAKARRRKAMTESTDNGSCREKDKHVAKPAEVRRAILQELHLIHKAVNLPCAGDFDWLALEQLTDIRKALEQTRGTE